MHLNYPNIPGEDLLENERVIVQRFTVQPEHRYPDVSPDGETGWMDPISLDESHDFGNVGKGPIDLIWVILKN